MSAVTKLLIPYEQHRVLRPLIQLIPLGFGSAIDTFMMQTLSKIREECVSEFIDELAKGNQINDEQLLESEDFLHCYITTVDLALKTYQRKKIRMFARLLKSSLGDSGPADIDEYEYFLNILDNLGFKEIQALTILDRLVDSFGDDTDNPYWDKTLWEGFENKLYLELGIPPERAADFMNGIVRTGCYELFSGASIRHTKSQGKLTPTFNRLKEFVIKNEPDA